MLTVSRGSLPAVHDEIMAGKGSFMSTQVAPTQAALAILVGMATLGLSDNLVVKIASDSSLWQFHLMRSVLVMIMLGAAAAFGFGVLRPKKWLGVIGRSAFQGVALLIYFGCLAIMPIGVVVAGFFTAPLFVALIAAIFQGKRIGPIQTTAILVGFIGALLVIRPDPAALDLVSFLPILAGLLYAIGARLARKEKIIVLDDLSLELVALPLPRFDEQVVTLLGVVIGNALEALLASGHPNEIIPSVQKQVLREPGDRRQAVEHDEVLIRSHQHAARFVGHIRGAVRQQFRNLAFLHELQRGEFDHCEFDSILYWNGQY